MPELHDRSRPDCAVADDGDVQGTTMPTLQDIFRARRSIAPMIVRTPLVPCPTLSARTGAPVHLKLEHQQITGSFKLRGATNAILNVPAECRARGVVAASTGNHGRALAHAAQSLGVTATICMSRLVPANKVDAIRALGADIRIVGNSQDDAQDEVDRLVRDAGLAMVPPFDHADIIAGQGTIGLELVEDLPEVRTVLVPLSGGGLLAGIAQAVKSANPAIRVIGVSMDRGPAMFESLRAGRPVAVAEQESLADSLGGGIGLANRFTFRMVRDLVDDVLLISEDRIADAVRFAYREEQQVVEGAAAVGIAALLAGLGPEPGPTAVVLSGRNIDMARHAALVSA
jgi:threonine dehydratase